MKTSKLVVALAVCLGLAACEQVVLRGPVGDATVTITDLRSGGFVDQGTTDGDNGVIARVGQEAFDGFNDFEKLVNYGLTTYPSPAQFTPATLYLFTGQGGFEFDSNADMIVDGPTPVQGAVHAVLTGVTLNTGAFAVSALTETAYQVVVDHVGFMNDQELLAALDEVARSMVNDADGSGSVNYADILRVNYLYADPATQVTASKSADLEAVSQAVSAGGAVQDVALAMFAADNDTALAETVYEASVAPILEREGDSCGLGCHFPGGSGSVLSNNDILPSSDPNYVQVNTENFKELVEANGVQHVVDFAAGNVPHPGSAIVVLSENSAEGRAFEAWLKLL